MRSFAFVFLFGLLGGLAAVIAGTNTLPVETGQIIQRAHVNKFQTALVGDFVPRSTAGVATDSAGNLGSQTLRWAGVYTSGLKLTPSNAGNPITLSAPSPVPSPYPIVLPSALPSPTMPLLVSPTGAGSFAQIDTPQLKDGAATYAKLGAPNYVISSRLGTSGTFSTTSTSAVQVTNSSISITVRGGHPVLFMLVNDPDNAVFCRLGAYFLSSDQTDAILNAFIALRKGGTPIAVSSLSSRITSYAFNDPNSYTTHVTNDLLKIPCGSIVFYDLPASPATLTYDLVLYTSAAHITAEIENARLIAVEL